MKTILTALLCLLLTNADAQIRRYVDNIAIGSDKTSNVVYGQAPALVFPYNNESNTTTADLVMDIYTPTGDTHDRRAAIIFAHSGGFINGNRNHDDIVALCDSFARRGYVTATIDYRKGIFFFSNAALHGTRAVYRGIQDGRTAVRYFRANAGALGIDPDQVYLAGSSAGGFIALHGIYMTETDEIPPETDVVAYNDFGTTRTTPDLGEPDNGTNVGFSGTPNGVVNLWGAVAAIDLVDATDDQPVFLAHGTADATVPFNSGSPFGFGAFPAVFGSNPISTQLATNGTSDFETYFVPGAGHEFYGTNNGTWANGTGPNVYWDTLLPKVTRFLWQQHKPAAGFTVSTNALSASFTDTSTGAIDWLWNFGDGNTSTDQNPVHVYPAAGTYPAELFVSNELQSWDTLEMLVTVDNALPLRWVSPLTAVYDGKDVRLSWAVANQLNTAYFIVEHSPDGRSFRPLGEVAAAGDLARVAEYSYRHADPVPGTQYYRIRQVDLDGRTEIGPLALLEVGAQLMLFPNPTDGVVWLRGLAAEVREVDVMDLAGRRVTRLAVSSEGALDLRGMPAGSYFVRLVDKSSVLRILLK
jgi:PKD repeat protein